jgi:hypothetical protein
VRDDSAPRGHSLGEFQRCGKEVPDIATSAQEVSYLRSEPSHHAIKIDERVAEEPAVGAGLADQVDDVAPDEGKILADVVVEEAR